MKKITSFNRHNVSGLLGLTVLLLAALFFAGCAATGAYGHDPYYDDDYGYDDYGYDDNWGYRELSYYGEWFYLPQFGRCWRPYVNYGWRPFMYGHWVWSNYGWTWVAYEPFGWIVFHYGYWNYDPRYGWFWIPGYDWAPARVRWVYYGGYVAWAPLPPPGVVWPLPWDYNRPWGHDYRYPRRTHVGVNVWVTVDIHHFTRENVGTYHVDRIPAKPRYRNDDRWVERAPNVSVVEQITRSPVNRVDIRTEDVRFGKGSVRRMELPEHEQARVQRYRTEIERSVIHKKNEQKDNHRGRTYQERPEEGSSTSSSTLNRSKNLHRYTTKPKYKKREIQ